MHFLNINHLLWRRGGTFVPSLGYSISANVLQKREKSCEFGAERLLTECHEKVREHEGLAEPLVVPA